MTLEKLRLKPSILVFKPGTITSSLLTNLQTKTKYIGI